MSVPDPGEALVTLHSLWGPLYAAFEQGTQVARGFFESRGKKPAPWVYADIVRWEALTRLQAEGFEAEEDVQLRGLANHGILIRYKGYTLRLMKSLADGELPGPGPSKVKQEFFQQLTLGPWGEEIRNLVVLWAPDEHHNLGTLSLACPKDGQGTKAEAHWLVEVPHPAVGAVAQPESAPLSDDLDIALEDAASASGGAEE